MVNAEEFTNRLKKIMDSHQLTASIFADQIGVQRSSISHILSGRNKPSLDFILKVTDTFKEVDIHWLLNGKGTYPKNNAETEPNSPSAHSIFRQENMERNQSGVKKVDRVVVFYNDGTFEEYTKN